MNDALGTADLASYFGRIGYAGKARADLATLTALHRAHVLTIPFENLDTQLGRPPGLDPAAAFAKLVTARRGGWCYEQNGLFGRALAALGFSVTRLGAGVMRAQRGDFSIGSHLCLKVEIDGQGWLADVGFGSSLIEPMPLAEQAWNQVPLAGRLHRIPDGYWQLAIEQGPSPMPYDFRDEPADEAQLAQLCAWQGTSGQSPFVQNLVVQQRLPAGHVMLRGKVLTTTHAGASEERRLASAAELVGVLRDSFALDVPEAARLWPAIEQRHDTLFAGEA